jgi:YggT family protein
LYLICTLLGLYTIVIFGRIIMSWVPVAPGGGMAQVASVLYNLTEPVLGPIRNAVPPVRLGMGALDLSPIIVIIGLRVLQSIIC